MITITIQTLGDEQFVRAFSRVGAEIQDLSQLFNEVYTDFVGINQRNFAAEGTPESWAPLSDAYAAWKQEHFPGLPILVLSRALRESLAGDGTAEGMGEYAIKDIHPKDAYFGTSVPYAIWHQTGTKFMPARKPVQITDEHKKNWAYMMHKWFVTRLKSATVEGGAEGV